MAQQAARLALEEGSIAMITVEEKSLELAMVRAAGQLGVTQDALRYRVVEKKSGFLGILGRKIRIEAWSSDEVAGQARGGRNQHRHLDAKLSKSSKHMRPHVASLCEYLSRLCSMLVGSSKPPAIKTHHNKERVIFEITNSELGAEIEKNVKIAEALEHLMRKYLAKIALADETFHVFVDCCGVRRKRERSLISMAKGLSVKVVQSKKPIVLNYKSSYDRKVIHMALENDRRVYTKSVGIGHNRKLLILPVKKST